MFELLRNTFVALGDQVWFFRFFVVIVVVCVYRTLLNFVLRSNNCANPFCSKCWGTNSVRDRAINFIKKNNNDDDSLSSIILGNLLQHERLCQKNDEKPTAYFHRGLSSAEISLPDQQVLIDHYDGLRQEVTKYLQGNDNIQWINYYFYKAGEENKVNCERFPKLFETLQLLPNAICINNCRCLFGNCFLTRLESIADEKEINQSGLTNCVIRMHFGLVCNDESSAYILINKRRRLKIENKRTVLYNNALEHSINNTDAKQQVFLTIDFWHPDLSSEVRKQLASIFHSDLA